MLWNWSIYQATVVIAVPLRRLFGVWDPSDFLITRNLGYSVSKRDCSSTNSHLNAHGCLFVAVHLGSAGCDFPSYSCVRTAAPACVSPYLFSAWYGHMNAWNCPVELNVDSSSSLWGPWWRRLRFSRLILQSVSIDRVDSTAPWPQ